MLALDVSSDSQADYLAGTASWRALCTPATGITIDQSGTREYRFSTSDAGWQNSWQLIRLRCVQPDGSVSHASGNIRGTASVTEIQVFGSKEISTTIYVGEQAPFSGAAYQNLRRRYGRRLHVLSEIDYSANTDASITARANQYLREISSLFPALTIDEVRPNARLFETVAVTQATWGYSARPFLITAVTVNEGPVASLEARDYSLRSA